jgi:hypothetical protein
VLAQLIAVLNAEHLQADDHSLQMQGWQKQLTT